MDVIFEWIDRLRNTGFDARAGAVIEATGLDANLLGVIALYLFCFAWLLHLWRTRHRPGRRRERQRGVAVADGIVHVLGAMILLVVSIFVTLARTAGRSHDRHW